MDSGIGGLSIAQQLHECRPGLDIVYLADSAYFPYGEQDRETLHKRGKLLSRFLIDRGCDIILIGCNSLALSSVEEIRKNVPERISLMDVLDVWPDTPWSRMKQEFGILATRSTVESPALNRRLPSYGNNGSHFSLAAPDLVWNIEYLKNHETLKTTADACLSHFQARDLQRILLACTHFPLIKDWLEQQYPAIQWFDTTALTVQRLLSQCAPPPDQKTRLQIFATEKNPRLSQAIERFDLFHRAEVNPPQTIGEITPAAGE